MEIAGIIILIDLIIVLIYLKVDNSIEAKLNIIIGALIIITILLAVNTYMIYPQYKQNKEIEEATKDIQNGFYQEY